MFSKGTIIYIKSNFTSLRKVTSALSSFNNIYCCEEIKKKVEAEMKNGHF